MHAYKGLVKNGQIVLPEGVELPEGAVVTVTIGEAEYLRAKLLVALKRRGLQPAGLGLAELSDLRAPVRRDPKTSAA